MFYFSTLFVLRRTWERQLLPQVPLGFFMRMLPFVLFNIEEKEEERKKGKRDTRETQESITGDEAV
jgi:hypothetical protein